MHISRSRVFGLGLSATAAAVAILFPVAANAQNQLEQVVVTGTREAQPLRNSVADIVLIDNDTLRDSGVGTVSESDVMLASASNALILGFNIRPTPPVQDLAERENVAIRTYRVIYDAIADIRAALEGLLESKYKEFSLGRCEIREVFRADAQLVIAGGYVISGKMLRNAKMRILRDDVVVHEGKLDSLRRFKEDVKEVASGYECGIGVSRFGDVKVGDIIECYDLEEVKQTLDN